MGTGAGAMGMIAGAGTQAAARGQVQLHCMFQPQAHSPGATKIVDDKRLQWKTLALHIRRATNSMQY